jgi:DNA-directed RNA polymerase subunit M/transcription elongation factor TFIIS
MSTPNFCPNCSNILEIMDMFTGIMSCRNCKSKFPCSNRVIFRKYYNTGKRMLSDNDIIRLMYEPSTQKIQKKCPECENNIMAAIIDENYKAILSCLGCERVFR